MPKGQQTANLTVHAEPLPSYTSSCVKDYLSVGKRAGIYQPERLVNPFVPTWISYFRNLSPSAPISEYTLLSMSDIQLVSIERFSLRFPFIRLNFKLLYFVLLVFDQSYRLILIHKLQLQNQVMAVGGIEERIKKMKEAIKSQAKQRALNIVEKAEEEADLERIHIIKAEKQKIDTQFNNQHKHEKVKAKIEKSSVINRQRIIKMQTRYELVEKMKGLLKEKFHQIVKNQGQYKALLKNLIVQGMLRMMQRTIYVETRKEHIYLVKEVLPACERQFQQIMKKQTGKDMEVSLHISEYSLEERNKNIIGGVFLRSSDGRIVTDNSFDARIGLIFEHLLPAIRAMLFDKKQ